MVADESEADDAMAWKMPGRMMSIVAKGRP